MGVRVAYGQRENIQTAIENSIIPRDSIIITKSNADSELIFYDTDGNLKTISRRTRFETYAEAEKWAKTYPCAGLIFSIQNGSEWLPYIVQNDNSLSPFKGETFDVTDINAIDGGKAGDN